jgi:hypothetical protein
MVDEQCELWRRDTFVTVVVVFGIVVSSDDYGLRSAVQWLRCSAAE